MRVHENQRQYGWSAQPSNDWRASGPGDRVREPATLPAWSKTSRTAQRARSIGCLRHQSRYASRPCSKLWGSRLPNSSISPASIWAATQCQNRSTEDRSSSGDSFVRSSCRAHISRATASMLLLGTFMLIEIAARIDQRYRFQSAIEARGSPPALTRASA